MVNGSPFTPQLVEHSQTTSQPGTDVGCIIGRLGSHMQWYPDRVLVVSGEEKIPHQLYGAEGSFPGTSGLCIAEEQGPHHNPHQQHNYDHIREQERGDTLLEAL